MNARPSRRTWNTTPGSPSWPAPESAGLGAALCGTDGRRGYLHHLAVAAFSPPGGRVAGEHCLAGLQACGIQKCHLFVFAGNAQGRAFWEHVGWRLRSDLVIMSKDLG